jgi:DNA-binding response OmpR family regulator
MRSRTVLIVEDDPALRDMFARALSMDGFTVKEARDGLEALRRIDADPPDLIVLDLMLPGVSGQAILTEIRMQAHTRALPVVVVTGSGTEDLDGLDANCVLRKPVSPDELVNVARACLAAGESQAT